jgi:hypothetical protein
VAILEIDLTNQSVALGSSHTKILPEPSAQLLRRDLAIPKNIAVDGSEQLWQTPVLFPHVLENDLVR